MTEADQSPNRSPSYHLARRFAVAGLGVIALAAAMVAHIQFTLFESQLRTVSREDHIQFARAIANDLREIAAPLLAPGKDLPATGRREQALRLLDEKLHQALKGTTVLKVKLIRSDGIVVFSTDRNELGRQYPNDAPFTTALRSGSNSESSFRKTFSAVSGNLNDVWVMSSFIALPRRGDGALPGVIETYTDITRQHDAIRRAGVENVSIVVGALILIYMVLLAIVWSAEQMLRAHHRKELSLAAAMTRAEAANKAKTKFLANMSHELRTPLNAIIGFSEIMGSEIKGPLGDHSYKGYADDISRSGRHLLGIIDKVLDLVRAESGATIIETNETNLAFIAKSVSRMMAAEAQASAVQLSVEAETDPLTIVTDAPKVREILLGLVSNGIKFTPKGGNVVIRVTRNSDTGGAVLTVADSGIGMRPEDIPLAVAPFGHIESVLQKTRGGIGLGLPLTRKLAELLGGKVDIATTPGKGTTVTVSLPPLAPVGAQAPKPLPNAQGTQTIH